METKSKSPNTELRYQREARGWSQKRLADALDTTKEMVSKWERGERPGKYYQEKLCDLFGKTAYELGFVKEPDRPTSASYETSDQKRLENNDLQGVLAQTFTQGLQGIAKELANNDLQGRFTQAVTQGILGVLANNDLQERLTQVVTQVIMGAVKELGGQDVNELRRKILEIMVGIAGGQAALGQIPSVGFPLLSTPHARPKQALAGDEMVADAGNAIRACWELSKSSEASDLALAFKCVSEYLPVLEMIAQNASQYRQEALNLAASYALLKVILGWHCSGPVATLEYAKHAVALSKETGDITLRLSAYSKLTWAYYYSNRNYALAFKTAQEAEQLLLQYQQMPDAAPLHPCIEGGTYSTLAVMQARNGKSPDVALGKASETNPGDEICAFMDFTRATMLLEAGWAHCYWGDHQKVIENLGQRIDPETLLAKIPQHGVGRVETIQIMTLSSLRAKDRNLERTIHLWTAGIEGAKALKSEEYFHEAVANLDRMEVVWPDESRIAELHDLVGHW